MGENEKKININEYIKKLKDETKDEKSVLKEVTARIINENLNEN